MLSAAILLGPQRHVPIVRPAVESLVARDVRPLAVVTAGWEERENEDQELRDHVQRPVQNLEIWARVERIFERDRELLSAMRQRHDTLRRVQELYRLRLHGAMEATKELFRRPGDDLWTTAERHDALVMLQGIDSQHVERVAQVHAEFEQLLRRHTWFTEGSTAPTFRNPGSLGDGWLERFGIDAVIHEFNCNWIAGLGDYPYAANWREYGARLATVLDEYFNTVPADRVGTGATR